jgi:pimeloyl-ACP methyl ester carboxylesterase
VTRILYFHGFASGPGSSKARFFASRFAARGVTLEIPDLAGGDFEHLTLTGQLDRIERLAHGDAVSLMGSSMGGYLAALYAAAHPEVRRVVLLAPAFGFARRWPEALGRECVDEWRRTGWMETVHYAEGRPRRLHYGLLEDGLRYPDYPDFRQPALIFHGAHDDVVPAAFSGTFAAAHPNAALDVVDSGHELHNVLDAIAPPILDFLLDAHQDDDRK